jgi:hypothetical protein
MNNDEELEGTSDVRNETPRETVFEALEEQPVEPVVENIEIMEEEVKENSNVSNPSNTHSISKRLFISIDTRQEDVLHYQHEGYDLFFEDQDRFLLLDGDIVEGLSYIHRKRYMVAEEITKGSLDFSNKPRYTKDPRRYGATARTRLSFKGGKPGMAYTWQFADQLPYLEDAWGLKPVTDESVKTFTHNAGSTRTIVEPSGRELIFCEFPKDIREAKEAAERDLARKRSDGYDEQAEQALKRSGAKPVGRNEIRKDTQNLRMRMNKGA